MYLPNGKKDFFRSKLIQNANAVIRNLKIIGEATKNVSKDLREQQQGPWREMAGLRDVLIHNYFGVDNEISIQQG